MTEEKLCYFPSNLSRVHQNNIISNTNTQHWDRDRGVHNGCFSGSNDTTDDLENKKGHLLATRICTITARIEGMNGIFAPQLDYEGLIEYMYTDWSQLIQGI